MLGWTSHQTRSCCMYISLTPRILCFFWKSSRTKIPGKFRYRPWTPISVKSIVSLVNMMIFHQPGLSSKKNRSSQVEYVQILIYTCTFQLRCQLDHKGLGRLTPCNGTMWHPNWKVQAGIYQVYIIYYYINIVMLPPTNSHMLSMGWLSRLQRLHPSWCNSHTRFTNSIDTRNPKWPRLFLIGNGLGLEGWRFKKRGQTGSGYIYIHTYNYK